MSWLDSTQGLACAYGFVGVCALGLGIAELVRRRRSRDPALWPTFWFLTAILLCTMAVARVIGAGDILADLGRQQARSEGWYDTRRRLQAAVVGSIAIIWGVVVIAALWKTPERRRRYVFAAPLIFTLVCFAAVRVISLHQLDRVLHNREYGGLTYGALIELTLLIVLALTGGVLGILLVAHHGTPAQSSTSDGGETADPDSYTTASSDVR